MLSRHTPRNRRPVVAIVVALGVLMSAPVASADGWSQPTLVDPAILPASVSCASSSFCATVGGTGASLWTGGAWTTPQRIDDSPLSSVSCPSSSFCVAVDAAGNALTYNGSSWSAPSAIDVNSSLQSVSCASTSFCAAVDIDGNALTYDGSGWTTTSVGADQFLSVSCASTSFCVAVDTAGGQSTYDGTGWGPLSVVDASQFLISVSCPSIGFCVAVDDAGNETTYNGTTWSTPTSIDVQLQAVSCTSSSFCVAADGVGHARTYNGTSWSSAIPASPIQALACVSASLCVGVDPAGAALTYDGSSWSAETELGGGGIAQVSCASMAFCAEIDAHARVSLYSGTGWGAPVRIENAPAVGTAISCPSATFCMAGDRAGNVITYNGSSWSTPTLVAPLGVATVTCTSPSFCVVGDVGGDLRMYNGSSWTTSHSTGSAPIDSVSCPTSGFCMAADAWGNITAYDGTGWGTPKSVAPAAVTSISCADRAFCAAVDEFGDAFTYDGSSWSAAEGVDGDVPVSVSCPTASFCLAVDDMGAALTYDGSTWSGPVPVDSDPYGFAAVSCPSEASCLAVDASRAFIFVNAAAGRPVNVAPPTISGAAVSGQTLTEVHGAWSNDPTSFTYLWQDCDPGANGCSNMGVTASSYTLSSIDVGHTVRVLETASNASGKGRAAVSAETGVVTAALPPPTFKPVNLTAPHAGGTAVPGGFLQVTPGTWSGTAPIGYEYQWLLCHPDCSGLPLGLTRVLTLGLNVGVHIRVRVTAVNIAGSTQAFSNVVTVVAPRAADVRAAIKTALVVTGPDATINQLLRKRGYQGTFVSPGGGQLFAEWFFVPKGAHLSTAANPLLVARGSVYANRTGRMRLPVNLTAPGKRLLARSRRVTLTERVTFIPIGGRRMSATRVLRLTRSP